jgi:argininosuccinate lyase
VVGRIVRSSEREGRTLESLSAADLAGLHPAFAGAPADITSVQASVRARRSPGGTAPDEVRKQLALAEERLSLESAIPSPNDA